MVRIMVKALYITTSKFEIETDLKFRGSIISRSYKNNQETEVFDIDDAEMASYDPNGQILSALKDSDEIMKPLLKKMEEEYK